MIQRIGSRQKERASSARTSCSWVTLSTFRLRFLRGLLATPMNDPQIKVNCPRFACDSFADWALPMNSNSSLGSYPGSSQGIQLTTQVRRATVICDSCFSDRGDVNVRHSCHCRATGRRVSRSLLYTVGNSNTHLKKAKSIVQWRVIDVTLMVTCDQITDIARGSTPGLLSIVREITDGFPFAPHLFPLPR